jgi:hypothetical protein
MKRPVLILLGSMLWLVGLAAPATAHNLLAPYRFVGDKVEIHAQFDDGTDAAGAEVTVLDSAKEILARGETDAHGRWSFPRPAPGSYHVTVHTKDGHKAQVLLPVVDPTAHHDAPSETGSSQEPDTAGARGLKIGIGVGVIGLLGLALLLATRHRQRKSAPGDRSPPPE